MLWTELRNTLCDLYPDEASIVRILSDADVATRYIDTSGPCIGVWDKALFEARKQGRLLDLLSAVARDYDQNRVVANARGILAAGGYLRESTGDLVEVPNRPTPTLSGGETVINLITRSIDAVAEQVRDLKRESEERGLALQKQISELRHETRDAQNATQLVFESRKLRLDAIDRKLEEHQRIMEKHDEGLEQLSDRPQYVVSRNLLWFALAVGVSAAFFGQIAYVAFMSLLAWMVS